MKSIANRFITIPVWMFFAAAVAHGAVDAKLQALAARGLDFSDAALFLPFAGPEGWFPYVESPVVRERWRNPDHPVAFFFDTDWQPHSRLDGQVCLYFNGINLSGNSGGGRLFQHEDSHTIAAWVAFADHPSGSVNMIFVEGHGGIGGRSLGVSWGHISHTVQVVRGERVSARAPFTGDVREWTHIAGVYDRPAKAVRLYVNGELADESEADLEPIVVDRSGFYIGANKAGGPAFNGWMDELALYNRPLSGNEIAQLYERGQPDPGRAVIPSAEVFPDPEFTDEFAFSDVWFYADFDAELSPVFVRGAAGDVETHTGEGRAPALEPGRFGRAVRIRGGETADSADDLFYTLRFPEREFSVAFWFRPDLDAWTHERRPWGRGFFATRFDKPSLIYGSGLQGNAGRFKTAPPLIREREPTRFSEDRWYHIAMVSSATGRNTIYVDGLPRASESQPHARRFGDELYLGRPWRPPANNPGLRIDGLLDEFLVLDRALSEQAIARLAVADVPAAELFAGIGFPAPRTAFMRGERVEYPLRLSSPGPLRVIAERVDAPDGTIVELFSGVAATRDFDMPLDTRRLAPGDYRLTVTLDPHGNAFAGATTIRILPARDPAIPFGVYAVTRPEHLEKMPDYLAKWRGIGIDFAHTGGPGQPFSRILFMDALYRHGIGWTPNMVTAFLPPEVRAEMAPEKYAQREIGTGRWSENNSLFSETAQSLLEARVRDVVSHGAGHPGFRAIALWDEYDTWNDVSPGAIRYFEERTGLSGLPDFSARPAGTVVPDDDPYARWIDTFGVMRWTNKRVAHHDARMTAAARSIAPGIDTFACPSGGYGGTTLSMPEVYSYLAETDHRRDIGRSELLTEAMIEVYRSSDMNRPRRPIWPLLGWWSTPSLPGFNESLRVKTQVALAKGAEGILFAADTWMYRDDMAATVRELARFRDVYGAFLKTFSYEDLGRVALLWNDYEMLGNPNPRARPGYTPDYRMAATLRLAGIPFEVVHVDQVAAGELARFAALFLPRFNFATESLKARIDAFAASGGTVFAARGQAALAPEGAIPYDPAAFDHTATANRASGRGNMENVQGQVPLMRQLVWPHLPAPPPVHADNPYFACYHVPGEGVDLYFVINTDLYHSQTSHVTFEAGLDHAYSLVAEGPVEPQTPRSLTLAKGAWEVLANYRQPVPGWELDIVGEGPHLTVQGRPAGDGTAAVPVTVRFVGPDGEERESYRRHIVTDTDGRFSVTHGFADNDSRGEWRIEATVPFLEESTFVRWQLGTFPK